MPPSPTPSQEEQCLWSQKEQYFPTILCLVWGWPVGRRLADDFPSAVLTYACILEPGETLASDRVIEEVGAAALSSLHFWYEIYLQRGNDDG